MLLSSRDEKLNIILEFHRSISKDQNVQNFIKPGFHNEEILNLQTL